MLSELVAISVVVLEQSLSLLFSVMYEKIKITIKESEGGRSCFCYYDGLHVHDINIYHVKI